MLYWRYDRIKNRNIVYFAVRFSCRFFFLCAFLHPRFRRHIDFSFSDFVRVYGCRLLQIDTTQAGRCFRNPRRAENDAVSPVRAPRILCASKDLPDGYDTIIGSGNIKLSGGEAQRLSIARTFLKDSEIVILDEALAYTDAENENLIQEAIKNLIKNKTVIVIAHRLKSIMEADNIIVLKEGKIIEEGTHENLLEKDGEYKSLWDLQFEAESWEIERKAGEQQ